MSVERNPNDAAELQERHRRESEFHDQRYSGHQSDAFVYGLHPTYVIFQDMKKILDPRRGSRVLECGCGVGWSTVELADFDVELHSFDISKEAVMKTRAWLERAPRRAVWSLREMAAESLDYPDGHFDSVIGFAILHHLEIPAALREIRRVLKPDGKAVFAEPLAGNPAINAFRRATPRLRTADEQPLRLPQFLQAAGRVFRVEHREYYLTALAPLGLGAILPPKMVKPLLPPFMALDRWVLKAIPAAGRWAWYSVLVLRC